VNFYFGPGPSKKRAEEALEAEKRRAAEAQADADAAKARAAASEQNANQANQQALAAQQGQNTAQQQALAAQQATAAAQAQLQQAQAEVEQVKQMVASKQINPITFATGSANLQPASNETLDKVADIAKKYPNLKLRVEGHTDSTGTPEGNQSLSQRRADSVRNYLTDKGVPADQISSVGFGETRPVASNSTADGRMQNRRVEFIFNLP
jgi:outer membrane protein OmpA-like peptidoglycan-associated protein